MRVIVAVEASESGSDDLNLPDRCQLLVYFIFICTISDHASRIKLANSVTYDRYVIHMFCASYLSTYHCHRMDKTMDTLEKQLNTENTAVSEEAMH